MNNLWTIYEQYGDLMIHDCEWSMNDTCRFKIMNVTTLALGLWSRQGLARLWAKRKPRSEGKCEGMNPHTPKGVSTLGVWSLNGFLNF
jgi:hypothetical protein